MRRRIAIGSVTKGFKLKSQLLDHLLREKHSVLDLGCFDALRFVKYPSVAEAVAHALYVHEVDFGVILCNYGTSSAAGVAKFQSVCACNSESPTTAEAARKVNGANVLCMGAAVVDSTLACRIVDTFINAEFLDISGVPPGVQEFRRQARDQLLNYGRIPETRELQFLE